MTIKAVLFDLGGTLLHYHDQQTEDKQRHFLRVTMVGVRAVYDKLMQDSYSLPAFEVAADIINKHIGISYMATLNELHGGTLETPVRAAFKELGGAIADDQWRSLRPALYHAIDAIVFPREGLLPTLEQLALTGYEMGIISNTYWAADLHDKHLQRFGIDQFFPHRIYSCDHNYVKPHRAIFEDMLERLSIEPAEAVYIGDTPKIDVLGAHNAGIRAIQIQSPYVESSTGDHRPDAHIAELADLPQVLEQMN